MDRNRLTADFSKSVNRCRTSVSVNSVIDCLLIFDYLRLCISAVGVFYFIFYRPRYRTCHGGIHDKYMPLHGLRTYVSDVERSHSSYRERTPW